MNTAIEERIRSRAYEIWEAEGRPEGREVDHWLRAAQEVAAETRSVVGVASGSRARTPRSAATAAASPSAGAAARGRARATKSKAATKPLP